MAKAKKEKAPSNLSSDPGMFLIYVLYSSFKFVSFQGEAVILNYLKTQNRPYSAGRMSKLFVVF